MRLATRQADLERETRAAMKRAESIAQRFASGSIGHEEFGDQFYSELLDLHAQSWRIGRALAGDATPDADDLIHGRAVADRETRFLVRFADQLVDGWAGEPGEVDAAKIARRMRLYIGKSRATAAEALVETSDPRELWEWKLGGVEEHCSDCPRIAAISPFAQDELFQYPGDGETPCLSNCKCHLVRLSDGLSSFTPFDF